MTPEPLHPLLEEYLPPRLEPNIGLGRTAILLDAAIEEFLTTGRGALTFMVLASSRAKKRGLDPGVDFKDNS